MDMAVIDVTDQIAGRLATRVAKRLLSGEEIHIVNAEKAIITGGRKSLITSYMAEHKRGGWRKGPYFPRAPHLILKRTIRGMLPYQSGRGRIAYKNLRVHIGVPESLKSAKTEIIEGALNKNGSPGLTIGALSRELGSKLGTDKLAEK